MGVQEGDPLVTTTPSAPGSLLRRQLLPLHRMVVFIQQQHRGALLVGGIGHKEISGIPDKNPLGIERLMLLENPDHIPIEPGLQRLNIGPLRHLA
jgi:hypothetical protein